MGDFNEEVELLSQGGTHATNRPSNQLHWLNKGHPIVNTACAPSAAVAGAESREVAVLEAAALAAKHVQDAWMGTGRRELKYLSNEKNHWKAVIGAARDRCITFTVRMPREGMGLEGSATHVVKQLPKASEALLEQTSLRAEHIDRGSSGI